MGSEKKFNIRVYVLMVKEKNVLLSDEFRFDMKMTKFPGGGLHFGEGTIDCIKREAMEEFHQEIEIIDHFYTTDFFQKTLFFENQQLISIYYLAKFTRPITFRLSNEPFDFIDLVEGAQSFRWCAVDSNLPNNLTFPVDKVVAKRLLENKILILK